jgi:hypothetical protein
MSAGEYGYREADDNSPVIRAGSHFDSALRKEDLSVGGVE